MKKMHGTMDQLEIESVQDESNILQVQQEAAREMGGFETKMLLDAPGEVACYHFGPLQIALVLVLNLRRRYTFNSKRDAGFQDDEFETYCLDREAFFSDIGGLRDTILHPRADNLDVQKRILDSSQGDLEATMLDAALAHEAYLGRLGPRLGVSL
ncbi:MAG: hypothetical protein F4Y16_06435 [Holophagales bacterium]|nr:hypothetical protein [Holophagales bacterium]MYH25326.1 hypothetical protein [Holophagales bacterium]